MNFFWVVTGTLVALLAGGLAFWKGGPYEKLGAVFILSAWFGTPLVAIKGDLGPGIYVFIIDLALCAALIWLALKSRLAWSFLAAICQIDAVAAHFIFIIFPKTAAFAYITSLGLWGGYGISMSLLYGALVSVFSNRSVRV
jgi:hypothetical protein